jgi:CDP-diacylglycerol--serine O-phosphatidyltransferase
MVALIFDMLDGKSARWTNSTSQFGVEYDSLADLVAFGVAPGLLMYGWALSVYDMLGPAVMFAFVACGALRLARFNVMTATSESKYFTGLPIPAAASVVATLVIFDREVAQFGLAEKPVMVLVLTLALAFLMVSTIKYRSFKDLKFRGRAHFDNLVLAILVLMLVIAWPQVMLFVLFACYAVSGPVERLIQLLLKPFGKRQTEQQPVLETKE